MSKPPGPGPNTERKIIHRTKGVIAGDCSQTPSLATELDRLFLIHRDRIKHLCLRMVKDPARAEELVQETLLTAYKKLPEFEGNARFGTWIFSIARNLCLNAVRRRADLLTEDGVLDAEDPSIDVVARLGIEERSLWLQRAASVALNPIEQEAVYLRYVEGMPQDAITEALGLDGTGARGLLQRCRRKLQRELQTQLTEMGRGVSFLHEG